MDRVVDALVGLFAIHLHAYTGYIVPGISFAWYSMHIVFGDLFLFLWEVAGGFICWYRREILGATVLCQGGKMSLGKPEPE